MVATKPYVIGLDIGTGSIKTIAMDTEGRVLASHRQHYPDGNWNVSTVLHCFTSSLTILVQEMKGQPLAVCLSSMMHGVMAVNGNGQPLMPLMLWSDTRAADLAASHRETEKGHRLYASTGTPLHAMSPLFKIRWIKENEPHIFNKAVKFISIKEYIWHYLFNEYRIDHSVASATGLFHIHKKHWDDEALAFAGISEDLLSEPVPVEYTNRSLSSSAAAECGLEGSTPFIMGASDGCLANLGSLCLEPSMVAVTIGTSAAVRITRSTPVSDVRSMPFSYILDENNYVCGGALNNGGNVVQWLVEKFLCGPNNSSSYEELFNEIASAPPASDGLVFLPYLNGERAPVWDEYSCGVYFGVRSFHERRHFLRAAVEGLCLAINDNLSILESVHGRSGQLRLSGGLSQNKLLPFLLADITGREILVLKQNDSSGMGACYLALRTLGIIKDLSMLDTDLPQTIKPNVGNHELYAVVFDKYRSLYPALNDLMNRHYK